MFSINDRHIIVNYHYVQDPSLEFSGIHPCSIKVFEEQIHFLAAHYNIVNIGEVVEAARNDDPVKVCAFTFDDGLRDHYENVLPILRRYKIGGTFFQITSTLEGRLPPAHKLHVLLSKNSSLEIINRFYNFLKNKYPGEIGRYAIAIDKRMTQKRMHEDIQSANLKETLMIIPELRRNEFLNWVFKELGINEQEWCQKIFMNEKELLDMYQQGFIIGGHSHPHVSLEKADRDFLINDIGKSKKILEKLLGASLEIFSYPHGRHNSIATEVLKEQGFKYAVTNESRAIGKNENIFLIPRYDTNDIKA